ncbi:MAG: hypothetical protein AAF587_02570 [Bacteroidota bacterium]
MHISRKGPLGRWICVLILGMSSMACESDILRPKINHSTFLKLYGGANDQTGIDLVQQTDGGFTLLGSTTSTDNPITGGMDRNLYWVQTDSLGDVLKSQIYHRSPEDHGKAMLKLPDGFLLLGEMISQNGLKNIWLIRSDLNGIPIWQKELGKEAFDDVPEDMILDADNHIWIVGTTTDINIHKQEGFTSDVDVSDIYLTRLDPQGNVLWERRFGFEGLDEGKSLVALSDGRVAVLGHTDFPDPDPQELDLLFFLVDNSGIPVLSQRFGEEDQEERAVDLLAQEEGGLILVANARRDSIRKPYVITLSDPNQQGVGQAHLLEVSGMVSGIAELPSGGFVMSGSTAANADKDFLLLRVGADMQLQWTRTFGSAGNSFGGAILAPSDSAFVFVGTHAFGSNRMMSLIKTNQEGQLNP